MKRFLLSCLLIPGLACLFAGCGGGDNDGGGTGTNLTTNVQSGPVEIDPDTPIGLRPGGAAAKTNTPEVVEVAPLPTEPIPVSTLKALLPTTIRGFQLHREQGRTNVMYTTQTTFSENTYFGEDSSILLYRIFDTHKDNVLRMQANQITMQPNLNEDTDTQYQLVTTYQDFPCYEKFVKDRMHSKIQVLVEGRVLVELTGIKIAIEDLRPLMRFFDLSLIQEHVKEDVVQQQYRAQQERDRDREAGG